MAVMLTFGNRKSTIKSLGTYVKEHFPNAAYGVYPIESDSKVAAVIVANKYSPNNFWSVIKIDIPGLQSSGALARS